MARLSLCYKVEAAAGTARRTPFGVYVNAQSTAVTSNYIGSTSTSTLTTNLALPSSVTVSSLSIEYIEICGDTKATSSEYVTVTIGSTTQRIYGGNQTSTFFASRVSPSGSTTTAFHGLDISSLVTGSPTGNIRYKFNHLVQVVLVLLLVVLAVKDIVLDLEFCRQVVLSLILKNPSVVVI